MNIEALRRDLAAKQEAARTLFAKHAATAQKAERAMTDDERNEVQAIVDEANAIKAKIQRFESDATMSATIEGLAAGVAPGALAPRGAGAIVAPSRAQIRATMGEQFVTSEAFEFFRKGGHRSASAWRSPSVELFDVRRSALEQYAATLTTDPASGGDLVVPDVRPGILPLLTRRIVVADLLAPGTTDSNLISYMKETTFTNAADTVAEGGTKPESTLIFDAVSDPVRKIAHWLPVTEEMLEDVAQIRSYIDARLRLGLDLTEEDQLLNGTVVAPDIVGLRVRTGLAADVARVADPSEPNADAVYRQMMAIFTSAFMMPDGIIMNPANWQKIQLSKTTTGEYLGSGPFNAPQVPTLWGLPVAVTPAITAGVALVGAFRQAAQIFRKGGVRVEASNSHSDFFVKNLVAIRAEERLALAVYRPGAIGEVTGLE